MQNSYRFKQLPVTFYELVVTPDPGIHHAYIKLSMLRICLIAAFPPSKGPLNEYSFHIAREIRRHEDVELIILADELSEDTVCGGAENNAMHEVTNFPNVKIIRCWK